MQILWLEVFVGKLNNIPGVRFTKQVQQTLSLILNSELIYSEIENSEFPVPETLIWVSLVNSE